jgi:glycosyltransferase involved in cell wall biosynthesis
MQQKPLLVIEFLAHGHHSLYVCHLVRFALAKNQIDVHFLLPRELRDSVLTQLSPEESRFFNQRVRVIEEDPAWLVIVKWVRDRRLAQFLYVECLNTRESKGYQLLYLYLESVVYQLALCPLPRYSTSGLMFRPTFYYQQRGMLAPGVQSKALFVLKSFVAYLCAKRPGIERVFLLDPLAQDYTVSCWKSDKFKLIPDALGPAPGEARPIGRVVSLKDRAVNLLIAGALAPRKGLHSTVDALSEASEETRRSVRLSLVGKPEKGFEDYVLQNLARLKDMGVEVFSEIRFVSDLELDQHMAQSDIVLTPYRGFKGSSGIVIRAAHLAKPVISTDEGLLGYLVQRHKLGAVVDLGNIRQFAQCLDRIVSTGKVEGFDPDSARMFADSCDPQMFAELLLSPDREKVSRGFISTPASPSEILAFSYADPALKCSETSPRRGNASK